MVRHLSTQKIDMLLDLLRQYPLTTPQAQLHAETHHRVYLITSEEGEFMLRVQSTATRSRLEREVTHLRLLAAHGFPVARVILTRDGAPIAAAGDALGLLMMRLSGERKALADADAALMTRLGELLAALHQCPIYDNALSEADALFGVDGFYPLAALRQFLTHAQQAALERVWGLLAPTLNVTGQTLLHGDFVLHNVLVTGQSLALVDLEYSRAGDARYDLASLLWQVRGRADWPALQSAFLAGYVDAGGQSHAELEPWLAARQLASLHWVAHNRALMPNADQVIAQRLQELSAFATDGRLRRQ